MFQGGNNLKEPGPETRKNPFADLGSNHSLILKDVPDDYAVKEIAV